jgi:hypothetical protein
VAARLGAADDEDRAADDDPCSLVSASADALPRRTIADDEAADSEGSEDELVDGCIHEELDGHGLDPVLTSTA